MGWVSFSGMRCKSDLIKYIVEHEMVPHKVHKHCVRGDTLWMVCENSETKYIACFLIGKDNGDWGYKDMCESMHPYRYHCPLGYLKLVPVANQEWRDEVVKFHECKMSITEKLKAVFTKDFDEDNEWVVNPSTYVFIEDSFNGKFTEIRAMTDEGELKDRDGNSYQIGVDCSAKEILVLDEREWNV